MPADTDVKPPEWALRLLMTHDHLGEPYCACCGEPVSKEHDEGCEVGAVIPLVQELVAAVRFALRFAETDPKATRFLAPALAPFEEVAE